MGANPSNPSNFSTARVQAEEKKGDPERRWDHTLRVCNENIFDSTKKLKKGSFYCWIDPILSKQDEFIFDFMLFIEHNDKAFQHPFKATYEQIKKVHNIAKNCKDCFATQKFPSRLDSKRSVLLKKRMHLMEEHMILEDNITANITNVFIFHYLRDFKPHQALFNDTDKPGHHQHIIGLIQLYIDKSPKYICKGPSKHKKTPSKYDHDALCNTLNTLFNAPSFALQEYLYKYLVISDILKNAVQTVASNWKNNLYETMKLSKVTDSQQMTYTKLLTDVRYKYMKFHSVVAAEEYNSSFTHWCLKFEGIRHLLTIDWTLSSSNPIFISILNNDAIGQRLFWYSFPLRKEQSFTKRWKALVKVETKVDMNENYITGSDIGNLINVWIDKYPVYNGITNNCQHFVRDIILVSSIPAANILTKKLQADNVGYLSPMTAVKSGNEQKKRKKLVKQLLGNELIRCKLLREKNSGQMKQLLDVLKLYGFYNRLLDCGFYDEDYHTINDDDLVIIGMQKDDRIRFFQHRKYRREVHSWLFNMKLERYFETFMDNAFESLSVIENKMTSQDLKAMDIPLGHRRAIVQNVTALRKESESAVSDNNDVIIISDNTKMLFKFKKWLMLFKLKDSTAGKQIDIAFEMNQKAMLEEFAVAQSLRNDGSVSPEDVERLLADKADTIITHQN